MQRIADLFARPPLAAFPFAPAELVFLCTVVCAFMAWDVAVLALAPRIISRYYVTSAEHYWMLVAAESVLYGSIMCQTTILAIWSSLADGSTLLRILVTTLIVTAVCMLVTSVWGSNWFFLPPANRISLSAGRLFILGLLLLVQIPLYGLRIALGWRLINRTSILEREPSKAKNALGAIFGYMAFFAFLTMLGQVNYDGAKGAAVISLLGLALVCAFCGIRFVVMLTDRPIWRPVLEVLASLPVVGGIAACGYHYATGRTAFDPYVFEGIFVVQVVAVGMGFATLFAARWFGLCLVTNRRLREMQPRDLGQA